jgi:hypothetical protein
MSFDQSDHFVPEAWYGTPAFSVVGRNELFGNQQNEKFEKRTRYFNYLPQIVTVIERNGLCAEFPPLSDASRNAFVIQTDWRVHKNLQTRFMQLLKDGHEHEPKSVIAMRECLTRHKPEPHEHWFTFRCELSVTQEELNRHRGEIYDYENDIVISISPGIDAGPHPYSETGRILTELHSRAEAAIEHAFFESIRIVDNAGMQGARYINRNGSVFRIKSARDPTLEDGVWVIRQKPYTHVRQPARIGWQRYDFDQADETLELYKSYDDAKHYGDGETTRKRELAAQEEKLARAKYKLKEQQLAHQQKQQEWEREKAKFQEDVERRQFAFEEETRRSKQEAERARFYYEQQMLEAKQSAERRKEVNDWLRQMPGILSAVGLAWLTYKTAKLQAK